MKNHYLFITLLFVLGSLSTHKVIAETPASSGANFFSAHPVPDRTVFYNVADSGVPTPIIWGLDTAWPSQDNMRRGIAFMGAERISIVRASFQPTHPLVNGDLQSEQISWLNTRLNLVNLVGPHATVMLNCDHPSVHSWYAGNAANWAALMDVTTRRVQERGRRVVSIAPFNEPDYTAVGQGTMQDFFNIAGELRKNPRFDTIRISGGNTLNTDQALPWYNYLRSRLDEGNTHQLAGSFNNYAQFFQTVRANGHHATNDELHNVMEAIVGVEYGMQTGIWWGTAEYARGEFVKASFGRRLGYAEHRPNWTVAAVYRHPDGKIQAFGGASERQATNTTYRFVSREKDVYYDGHGPQREYTLPMPGGTGYHVNQPNAERVVNITWGDDIQPVINGRYALVNRNSGMVMQVSGGSANPGANVNQGTYTNAPSQQWNVTPVDSRIGGDFSYFTITAVHSGMSLDVYNWSLNNNANIIAWNDAKGHNQQWYLEYVGDGWFYIRSRHSAKCLEVQNNSTANNANVQQRDPVGVHGQLWRFIPIDAVVEFDAPAAPANLTASGNAASVLLEWSASTEPDVAGYHIFRADSAGGPYNTIARNVTTLAYVDNTALAGKEYFYVIRAVDKSLNRSENSAEVSATATGARDITTLLSFEDNLLDSSTHLNHAAAVGNVTYVAGKIDSKAMNLTTTNPFIQLPSYVANHEEITIATWINWRGGSMWQRVFDFGNGDDSYMFLTPRAGNGRVRFAIKNGGDEQQLNGTAMLGVARWIHVAVTLGKDKAVLYLDGVAVDESENITISPNDFKPILNYIGRSQFSDPMLGASIDDFRIYNYALSNTEVGILAGILSSTDEKTGNKGLTIRPVPVRDFLTIDYPNGITKPTTLSVYDLNGKLLITQHQTFSQEVQINTTSLPAGIYMLRISNEDETLMQKFVVMD